MRSPSPELLFRNEENEEKPLHSFEAREADEQYSINLAEKACDALHRFALDKTTVGLAELHSDITERAYSLIVEGLLPARAITTVVEPIRSQLQAMLRLGNYAFTNVDIFAQLGKAFELGLSNDLAWLEGKFQEAPEEGKTRQIYTSSELDDKYAIDFIEAIWQVSPDGELVLERVDLVQKKSSNRLPDEKCRDIAWKHRDFVRTNEAVIAELKAIEATEDQIRELKGKLGQENEVYLATSFREACEGSADDALPYFRSALAQLKEYVLLSSDFISASKPLKRAYIEQLSVLDGDFPGDQPTPLSHEFNAWKAEWLVEIGEKRKRVLSPANPETIRSIISFGNGEEKVEIISGLTKMQF